jgi:copper chaperone CopZ
VSAVTVELPKKQAAITLQDAAVSNEALKAAVEEAGYEVLDIQ